MASTLALFIPGYLRIGRVHVPVYGIFAAAGLVAALMLSQRTAKPARLPPEKIWDAGMFAVLAAFVASRVLLVISDPASFVHYPLLVMSLPSLTYSGMLLTGLLTWLWLRWKRLSLLSVADAWAPCGALLWAVLSLGHFVEGTDAGMPTQLPWGVVTPGDTVLGKTHPVQIYTMVFALALCGALMWMLRRTRFHGEIVSVGLMAGGAVSFLLGMLRQPTETFGDEWLEPAQLAAGTAILAGAFIWFVAKRSEPSLRKIEQSATDIQTAEEPR